MKKEPLPYHHGNLRQTLIDAALEIIGEKGVKALSIREVAKKAGVSHAAPYRHFTDKDDLLSAVAIEGFDMVLQDTLSRFERHRDSPLERFRQSGLAYIDFAAAHPSHYRVMFSSSEQNVTDGVDKHSREAFMILYTSIAECQEKKLVKAQDTFELAMAAWSLVHGYAMLVIDGFIKDPADRLKYVITDALYRGLCGNNKLNDTQGGNHA